MKKSIKRGLMYGITANVILLSLTSLLNDVSSEIIQPLIPLFMTFLGASALAIGILGGLSDSIAAIFHMLSGYLSDLKGKRKPFIISGYFGSAVAKLVMSFAKSWPVIFIMRPIERIGKGLREPPRDAILAETTPKEVHGKVFGVNRAFDRTGAIIGSLLALAFIAAGFAYNKIFFIAALIAFAAVIPLIFVMEKKSKPKNVRLSISLKKMPKKLRAFIIISTLFALANFSYVIFILRVSAFYSASIAVALYLLSNLLFQIFATPSGILADKIGKKRIIYLGYALFALACLIFVLFNSLVWFVIAFAIYGLSQAMAIGNERALTADLSKKKIVGTSLGTFYLFNSLAALPAGIIAGALYQYVSPAFAFGYGAIIAGIAAIILASVKIDG
jgi:MFS family permease